MNLTQQVANEVQAALLNSECDPKEAVRQALIQAAQFAEMEFDCTLEEFLKMADASYRSTVV